MSSMVCFLAFITGLLTAIAAGYCLRHGNYELAFGMGFFAIYCSVGAAIWDFTP